MGRYRTGRQWANQPRTGRLQTHKPSSDWLKTSGIRVGQWASILAASMLEANRTLERQTWEKQAEKEMWEQENQARP